MEVSDRLHALATSLPGKSPRYPLDRRLDGHKAGLDAVVKRKILPLPGIEPRQSSL
jgi:hypothetical protein